MSGSVSHGYGRVKVYSSQPFSSSGPGCASTHPSDDRIPLIQPVMMLVQQYPVAACGHHCFGYTTCRHTMNEIEGYTI